MSSDLSQFASVLATSFHGMSASDLLAWAGKLNVVSLDGGAVYSTESEPGPSLFVVLSGGLRMENKLLGQTCFTGPGQITGAYGLLTGARQSPVFQAIGPTRMLRVDTIAFERLQSDHPNAAQAMLAKVSEAIEQEALRTALNSSESLRDLDDAFRIDLERELEPISILGGETLLVQGAPGDCLYVVISGRLRALFKNGDSGQEIVVGELGPGETVGEMALISDRPRTASIYAIRDSRLAKLSKQAYHRLLLRHPEETMRVFAGNVVNRLERANAGSSRPPSRVSTIAVFPASPNAPLRRFCGLLVESLSRLAKTCHVSSQAVSQLLGSAFFSGSSDSRLDAWLHELEIGSVVVFESDPTLTPWTRQCLRQADYLLFVADAEESPALSDLESQIVPKLNPRTSQRQALALVHTASGNPSGTKSWLMPRQAERHHHVRLDCTGDFDRLARFLTGSAVGLTLGGGFARGLAHIGVLRAMRTCGVPIDAIGGTSMGAVIGALFAMGWNDERIVSSLREGCQDSFNDMTLPFVAFKSGRKFSALLQSFFGETQIEDLWTPYFCLSANLNRAQLKLHSQGSLTKASLASTRAPGLFPPIVYDGELHIDGGVINNVPVDLMRPFCDNGVVFGVDVSPPHELLETPDYGFEISGWDALRSRFGWGGKKKVFLPSLPLVLIRTLEFTGVSQSGDRLRNADLYLRLPMLGFKRTDWHRAEDFVKVGYESALEQIQLWQSTSRHSTGPTASARACSLV